VTGGVSDGEALAVSLGRFVNVDGYDAATLRSDLARFAFLLTCEEGARLFGGEPGEETFSSLSSWTVPACRTAGGEPRLGSARRVCRSPGSCEGEC
jgi:hypothetical protein